MQQVEYSVFPNVSDAIFLPTINKILGHIQRTSPTFKEFREWMREDGLWHKELVPQVLSIMDVTLKPKPKLGKWAKGLLDAEDTEAQQEHIFKLLLDGNTLLVKYVMEALDMEGGGRLHSTYELHRMLTSYVYPGETIRLPDFQAWIRWIVLSGRVKLIGIRWGLTDAGKEIVPRLRMIDVEEFLEDEAEEDEEDEAAEEEEEAAAPALKVAAPTKKKAAAAPAKSAPAAEEGPEDLPDLPDLPPEPPPVDEEAFARYQASLDAMVEEPEPVAEAEPVTVPSVSRRVMPPRLAIAQRAQVAACDQNPLELADVIAQLREEGRKQGLAGGSLLLASGLEPRLARSEAQRFLFLAGLLARLYAAAPDGRLAQLVIDRVGGLSPIAVLLDRPEALTEVVVRWGLALPTPEHVAARRAIMDAVIGGRALKARKDLATVLAEAPKSVVLITELQRGLLKGAPAMAAFWLVRELVRVEVWTHPAAKEIAFVPSRDNRLMAYRLRLLDSHFAHSTARLIAAAQKLATAMPAGSVEAAAFEVLAPDDHLRFDCNKVTICQEPCAWRAQ
ncbi:MAG: hypothetical protein KC502_01575 [Myxococcales bacterium]|nr:hypothetical protein [Myxococcales bacterium]